MKKSAVLYLCWFGFAALVPLMVAGLDAKNITLLCAVGFLLLQLACLPILPRVAARVGSRRFFIGYGVFAACGLEIFHMISQPFNPTLLVTRGMSAGHILENIAIDLAFTVPCYCVIFSVLWMFVRRYRWSTSEYFIVVSLGQSLGDGGLLFFLGAPFMLLFLPYTLVKYQAMNLAQYLAIRGRIAPQNRSWARLVLPVAAIVITYLVCGGIALKAWAMLHPGGR